MGVTKVYLMVACLVVKLVSRRVALKVVPLDAHLVVS